MEWKWTAIKTILYVRMPREFQASSKKTASVCPSGGYTEQEAGPLSTELKQASYFHFVSIKRNINIFYRWGGAWTTGGKIASVCKKFIQALGTKLALRSLDRRLLQFNCRMLGGNHTGKCLSKGTGGILIFSPV